jgi:translation initiation factor IF-3
MPSKQDKDMPKVNEEIRVPRVRVVGGAGEILGILTIAEARERAAMEGLDLVEVAPTADPPVCRVMDYGKFKYEKSKKQKEARKKQHVSHLKEIKMHPKTEEHDYHFKMDHARNFLFRGDRVKATIVFRGREIAHIDFGRKILERFEADIIDLCSVEFAGKMEGRNMISMFVPDKAKIKEVTRKMDQERRRLEQDSKKDAPPATETEIKPEITN